MALYLDVTASDGQRVDAVLRATSGRHRDPVLCFSMMAPVRAIADCTKIDGLAGFTVLRLHGELSPDQSLSFTFDFENPDFRLGNRAWLPQGPYLRDDEGRFPPVSISVRRGVDAAAPVPRRMPHSGLALVPAPQRWSPAKGEVALAWSGLSGHWGGIAGDVENLAATLCRSGTEGADAVRTSLDESIGHEGYRLEIGDRLHLSAATETGAFHGMVTLLSLALTHEGRGPRGVIEDAPRFGWRGFMLDCVRCYYPVADICRLLDLMAVLKLNRFHWHFADDEAFRLELECAPDIWRGSAFRGEGLPLPGLFGGGADARGGSYSRADVAAVLDHAKRRRIEVLPEIEVPAHALALTTLRPDLRDPDDTGTEHSVQGYPRNAVNPAMTTTWDLLEPLAREVAGQFPFAHLHLGGDELPPGTWDGSPAVTAMKARTGLRTSQDVQGHVMHRLAGVIAAEGITPCAWQEAGLGSQGGIGHDAILFSWTGAGPGREAAESGYRVVMCPAQHCYFDMAHTADPDDWGANWAATFALDKAFDWEPVPDGLSTRAKDRILGVQGTFWSEFTDTAREYEAMIAPRILGLATRAWSSAEFRDLSEMRSIATCYGTLFKAMNWQANAAAIDLETPEGAVNRADD